MCLCLLDQSVYFHFKEKDLSICDCLFAQEFNFQVDKFTNRGGGREYIKDL